VISDPVYTVVSMPTADASIGMRILPHTDCTVRSAEMTYLVFAVSEGFDLSYTDPVDGELLIDAQTFISFDAAQRWIHSDIRYRGWRSRL
jgi:hypothetical protein